MTEILIITLRVYKQELDFVISDELRAKCKPDEEFASQIETILRDGGIPSALVTRIIHEP